MFGISSSTKEAIGKTVTSMFDRISRQFVGPIPRQKDNGTVTFNFENIDGLPNLYIQALGNRYPTSVEKDVLKSLLMSADGYVNSLKSATINSVATRIEDIAREARSRGLQLTMETVEEVIREELGKARSKMQTIAEAESTKVRNMGSQVDIAKTGASLGETDPHVFFVVTKDASTCKECIRLHLMPDGITPRVWRMSELKQGYHKRGEDMPSACGEHPFCRCTLTIMPPGWTFNEKGHIKYKANGHREMDHQRSRK